MQARKPPKQHGGHAASKGWGCSPASKPRQRSAYHATHEAGQALHKAAQLIRDGLLQGSSASGGEPAGSGGRVQQDSSARNVDDTAQ